MSAFVLDASVALAWHFRDEMSDRVRRISTLSETNGVVVPRHWFAEVANGMLIGERRQRVTSSDGVRFAERISLLDLAVDAAEPTQIFGRILPLARAHKLTVYDTFYLELAERHGLRLASLDRELNDAARRVGIELVEPI